MERCLGRWLFNSSTCILSTGLAKVSSLFIMPVYQTCPQASAFISKISKWCLCNSALASYFPHGRTEVSSRHKLAQSDVVNHLPYLDDVKFLHANHRPKPSWSRVVFFSYFSVVTMMQMWQSKTHTSLADPESASETTFQCMQRPEDKATLLLSIVQVL